MEHITLSGHSDVFPLSADAKHRLVSYLSRARASASQDPDGDESVRDLESTIGDQLRSILDSGAASIDGRTMADILDLTGPLEPASAPSARRAPVLCRIQQGKWFGGLVLGIATRGQFNVDWTRTVMFGLLLITGGTLGIAYLIALLFAPPIETADEYRALLAADRERRTGGTVHPA